MRVDPRFPDRIPGATRDGVAIAHWRERDIYNVIVDHCSVAWGIDENVSIWAKWLRNGVEQLNSVHDITIQNTIISEGLHNSIHIDDRNGLFGGARETELINNIVYNWGSGATKTGALSTTIHIVENIYKAGNDSNNRTFRFDDNPSADSAYYLSENLYQKKGEATLPREFWDTSQGSLTPV